MNSTQLTPISIPTILKEYGLAPKKSMGQNFLIDDTAIERIIEGAGVQPDDCVLEIGPGLGSLTRYLAIHARRVVAVELDQKLIPPLKKVLLFHPNVEVIHGDMLQLDPNVIMGQEPYICIANIPYYITSALMRHLLAADVRPERVVFTMQKEVSERILAADGKMSLLSLSVHVYGKPSSIASIPARAFYPAPKVDSATLRVDLYETPLIPMEQLETFFRLAKAGFSQKRKNLRNSLAGGLSISKEKSVELLEQAGIETNRRAETLTIEEWGHLTTLLTNQSNS
jgi:16S rRNA (adenine1518-N6/adenine1519-N6)-dimethyltransferase